MVVYTSNKGLWAGKELYNMKKIISLLAAAALLVSVTACGKNVTKSDMSKVEGKTAAEAEQTEGTAASGELANSELEIKDSKVIDTDEGKALVVSVDFKNNNESEKSFDGLFDVTASQNGVELGPANAVTPQEGIDLLSASTPVKKGDRATAQLFFALDDEESDVTVQVFRYSEPSQGILTKTFKIN